MGQRALATGKPKQAQLRSAASGRVARMATALRRHVRQCETPHRARFQRATIGQAIRHSFLSEGGMGCERTVLTHSSGGLSYVMSDTCNRPIIQRLAVIATGALPLTPQKAPPFLTARSA
ncbi:hypothetical protein DEA98_27370 [Brucella pseudogrignonensis]|nr:hypothetical protein [Brucella pseudogrignonensis]